MVVFGTVRIGVLGGIGPEATGEFYNKLIKRLQEESFIRSNQDYPQIIINSIPAPELIYEHISEHELMPYINGLKQLDAFGVDIILMVCNTIHLYYERLQKEIKTQMLDLRQEVRNALMQARTKSVFILGTPNTIKQKLYHFEGIRCFEPNEEELKQLTTAIFQFNKGVDKQAQIGVIKKICQKYILQGAELVILGCTEFALMLGDKDIPVLNTIDVLVEAVVNKLRHKS